MLNFNIKGKLSQTLEITLQPGEVVKSEPGAMIYMESGIEMEGKIFEHKDDTSFFEKIKGVAKRFISGESLRIVYYKNVSDRPKKIALAPSFMGEIAGIQLEKGEKFIVQSGGFLAGTPDIDISVELVKNVFTGIFGGDGFILQKLVGPGIIFINSFGTLHEIELNNETLYVDNSALVGYTEGIKEEIEQVHGLSNIFLSGEGLTNIKLSGKGTAYIQNIDLDTFANEIASKISVPSGRKDNNDGLISINF